MPVGQLVGNNIHYSRIKMAKTIFQVLKDNTKQRWKKKFQPSFNIDSLKDAVQKDSSLNTVQQQSVMQHLADPQFVSELKDGAIGAAIAYLLGKYFNLKSETKVLLSVAGFGIGKLIYDYSKDPKQFSTFNPVTKMQEIN